MSDQFTRQKITREIAQIKSQALQAQKEVTEMRRVFNEAYATAIQERDDLRGRVAKLQSEVKELWADCEQLKQERDEAIERAEKCGKALEFYADTENWDETEDPVITSRDPLGSTPYFHIVFLGQDDRWPGHPSTAAIEALEPTKKGEAKQ